MNWICVHRPGQQLASLSPTCSRASDLWEQELVSVGFEEMKTRALAPLNIKELSKNQR